MWYQLSTLSSPVLLFNIESLNFSFSYASFTPNYSLRANEMKSIKRINISLYLLILRWVRFWVMHKKSFFQEVLWLGASAENVLQSHIYPFIATIRRLNFLSGKTFENCWLFRPFSTNWTLRAMRNARSLFSPCNHLLKLSIVPKEFTVYGFNILTPFYVNLTINTDLLTIHFKR